MSTLKEDVKFVTAFMDGMLLKKKTINNQHGEPKNKQLKATNSDSIEICNFF